MEKQPIYILDEDKKAALERIAELESEIMAMWPEFYDVFNQSSETWHDNAPFDGLRDKQSLLDAELQGLRRIIKNAATSIPVVNSCNMVSVGSRVDVVNVDDDVNSSYFIAGDWTRRAGQEINGSIIVSSKSPIAQALIGRCVGDMVLFKNNLKIISVNIRLNYDLPCHSL